MSAYEALLAVRPELAPETPFAAVLDALADTVLTIVKAVESVQSEDFREEFDLRTADEQTDLGIVVTLAVLTVQRAVDEIGDAVSDAFEASEPELEAAE